ncbi:MAG: hypothetical protein AAF202_09595, partial [Pseudomonadota bacterium]
DERADAMSLKAYLWERGIAESDMYLFTKARRLLVAMLSGAGLETYMQDQSHQPGVSSAYEELWFEFLNEVKKQGEQQKPILAFVRAFESVQKRVRSQAPAHPLAFLDEQDDSKELAYAMDTFFTACAR